MSEMTATRIVRAATVATSVALGVVAASLLWRTRVPADLRLRTLDPRDYFSAADLARIDEFRGPQRSLFLASLAVELAVVGAAALRGPALAARLAPLTRGRIRAGAVLAVGLVVAAWLVQTPLAAAAHRRRRRFGLTEQGWSGWLRDELVGLAVLAVLVAIGVAGAMLLARRLGPRWWLAGGPALAAAALAFVVAQPVVVAPLFNRFEPLEDVALRREIAELARRLDVDVDRIEVADASRRTTTANAYVAGIGPSRRVVLYDTALAELSREELVAVAAHELAHVGRHHLWKGLAWFALLAVPGVLLVARIADRRGGAGEPAAVPLGLFVALAFSLVTLPVQNALSRRYEAEADWLALEATRAPAAARSLDRRLVVTNLGDPDPPGWVTFWFGTHPPALARIAMAEAWAGRATSRVGEPPAGS